MKPTLADRLADHLVAALVGGPVRSVLAGAVLLVAAWHWLGWWAVGALLVAAIADFVWCMSRLPARWRMW